MLTPEEKRQVEQVLLEFARLGQARATQPAELLARLPAGPEAVDHLVDLARAEGLPWIGHLARTAAAAEPPPPPVAVELQEEDAPLSFADAWGSEQRRGGNSPSAAERPRPSAALSAPKAPQRPGWFWPVAAVAGLGAPLLAIALFAPAPPPPAGPIASPGAAVAPAPARAPGGAPPAAPRGPIGQELELSGVVVGVAQDCPVVKSGGRYYMVVAGPAGEPRTGERLAVRARVSGRSPDGVLYVEALK